MGMNASGGSSAERPVWRSRKFLVATAVIAAVLIGGSIATTAIAQRAAAEHAAAEAAAKEAAAQAAEQAELEAAHDEAIRLGKEALDGYEPRYSESEDYGDPVARAELRERLDALTDALSRSNATTADLNEARWAASDAYEAVGTREEAEERKAQAAADAAAEAAAAAAKALDQKFAALAEISESDLVAVQDAREYCAEITDSFTPDNIIATEWKIGPAFPPQRNAAIRVYCPQFIPPMELVLAGFHSGDHVVGSDISAGTYRTTGPVSDCYWERNDGSGNILDNNFVTAAHNGLTVRLNNGEGFTSDGCGFWVPVR